MHGIGSGSLQPFLLPFDALFQISSKYAIRCGLLTGMWRTHRRSGLFERQSASDQVQISVDPGHQFDLDQEIDGLRGQLSRLKQVQVLPFSDAAWRNLCCTCFCTCEAASSIVAGCIAAPHVGRDPLSWSVVLPAAHASFLP